MAATAAAIKSKPAVEYESPYRQPPAQSTAPQKRSHSEYANEARYVDENDEKRQRIGSPATVPARAPVPEQTLEPAPVPAPDHDASQLPSLDFSIADDDALARIIAEATAQAERTFLDANTLQADHDPSGQPAPSEEVQAGSNTQLPDVTTDGNGYDTQLYMRILSLPMLENLSLQILTTLARGPLAETLKLVSDKQSDQGQAYSTLKSLFDQTTRIYSNHHSFLSANELGMTEAGHRSTLRTTNLATFLASVFGLSDVGFYELNDHFMSIFGRDGVPLEPEICTLYLELKTQMYLAARDSEESKADLLDYIFPTNLSETLLQRHRDTTLTPGEIAFLNEMQSRREYLHRQTVVEASFGPAVERYSWDNFQNMMYNHLKTAYEPLLAPFMPAPALNTRPAENHSNTPTVSNLTSQQNAPTGASETATASDMPKAEPMLNFDDFDFLEAATKAATEAALQSVGYGSYPDQQAHNPPQVQQQQPPPIPQSIYGSPYPPAPSMPQNQTWPAPKISTQQQYQIARQQAASKSAPNTKRLGLPSQRRPWTTDEENALMAGLDQVKGPHWSQILALYGVNGSICDILKDRNQVQLKDKARNLKLFFLKNGMEVPYYLSSVTGELKTRAPTQAARKEAEERARLAGDEEQARFNSIMALAGGLQHHAPQASQSPNVTSPQASHDPSQGVSGPDLQDAINTLVNGSDPTPQIQAHVFSEEALGAQLRQSIEQS